MLYVYSVRAVASALLLSEVSIAVWLSLAFGLVGMASAGVIMTAAPPIAGWLYDRNGDPYVSVQFAAGLFAAAALANAAFRLMKRRFGV